MRDITRKRERSKKGAMVGFQHQRRLREEQHGGEEGVQIGTIANVIGSTAVAAAGAVGQRQHGSSSNGRANSPKARLAMLKRSSTKCKGFCFFLIFHIYIFH